MTGTRCPTSIRRATFEAAVGALSSPTLSPPPPPENTALPTLAEPPPPPGLLTIPRELRDSIYEYLFTSNAIICVFDDRLDIAVPSIRRTCKQISAESLEAWLKFSIFQDCSTMTSMPMMRWLARVPNALHKSIKTIRFYGSTDSTNIGKATMLAKRQRNLVITTKVDQKALLTTFTTPAGRVVWASGMPQSFDVCDRRGTRG